MQYGRSTIFKRAVGLLFSKWWEAVRFLKVKKTGFAYRLDMRKRGDWDDSKDHLKDAQFRACHVLSL